MDILQPPLSPVVNNWRVSAAGLDEAAVEGQDHRVRLVHRAGLMLWATVLVVFMAGPPLEGQDFFLKSAARSR